MWRGLPASILMHAGVLFGGAIAWPYLSPPRTSDFVVVPIDLVTIAPTTNIAPSVRREAEEEPEDDPPPLTEADIPPEEDALPEEDEIEEEEAFTPPPPPPEENEPEPEPPPDETEETEEAPEEPEDEPEPEPEPVRTEPERDPLDDILGEASNLFDRAEKTPRRAPPQPKREIEPLENKTASEARRGVGDQSGMTARVEAILVSQLKVCWDSVDDLPNPERLQVTVRMQLKEDGALARDAQLVKPSRPPIGDRPMQVAVERALRAVRKCAPYRLPEGAQAYYAEWKDVTVNIGPEVR